jgi:peptidoglycan hydrolase-like protein with peptidoglycan-binding domain
MEPIQSSFDLNKVEDIQNLALVLEYITGKTFKPIKYQAGVLSEPIEQYLQELKKRHSLVKEKGLSPKVIQLVNQLWIDKKYQDPIYIHQLHTWLKTLGYKISQDEFEASKIGKTTTAILVEIGVKYDFPITKQLNLSLENHLRTAYEEAIVQETEIEPLKINDVNRLQKVVAPLSLNDKGKEVQQLQLALAWLGYTVDKAEYRKALLGEQTKLAIITYQKDNKLEDSGDVTLGMAMSLNTKLLTSQPNLLEDNSYIVRGAVKNANWEGIEGANIQVYEQVLRKQGVLLGEKMTINDGSYDLTYTPPVDKNGNTKEIFHLTVQIQAPNGSELKTETIFNVSPTTWVNYTDGNLPYQGKSVYEKNIKLLTPHLEGLSLDEIEESKENKDVEYLNATSGLGGNEIMFLSLAHRLATKWEEYEIDASVFYGLFKQELPLSLPSYLLPDEFSEWSEWMDSLVEKVARAIALIPEEEQVTALQKTIKFNIIPIHQSNELGNITKKLNGLRLNYAEKAPLIGQGIALDTILVSIENLSNKERTSIIEAFSQEIDFSLRFIENLVSNKVISTATEGQLKEEYFLLQLGRNQLDVISNLKAAFYQKNYSAPISQVSDFAKWSLEDWKIFIDNIAKEGESSKRSSELTSVTAEALHTRAIAFAPSVATVATLNKGKITLLQHLPAITDVIDGQQWRNLTQVPIVQEIKENKLVLEDEVVEELKLIQRIEKITSSPAAASILINSHIHSAHKALGAGVTDITQLMVQGGMSSANASTTATTINQAAQQQVGAVLGIGTLLQVIGNDTLPTNVLPQLANWEELFGDTDTCACEHCRSVYSPAAYLTDLLSWLQQTSAVAQNTLLDRRPDLEYILLNCKNAHTPLPYVDLVNEVLEYAIIQDPGYIERNTTWTAEELKLQGEYQLDSVYEQFIVAPNNASYKPYASYNAFNLWQSKFHLYLEKLGIQSYELVERLGKYSSTHDTVMAIGSSYFRMPSHETQDILSNHYDYSTHPTASNNVEQFLKHHNLSYEELIELLQCSYIKGDGSIQMSNLDTCTLSDRELLGLTATHYNKIWRFLRLWKYTGWQLRELNMAIEHPLIGNGFLIETTLRQIVRIHKLQQQLEVKLEECLTLFSSINTEVWHNAQDEVQESLYHKIYLSALLDETVQTAFDPDNFQINLQSLTTEQINYIAVALSTNTTTIQKILNAPPLHLLSQNNITTTVKQEAPLSGLSQLYTYVLLLKQLSISIEDLLGVGRLLYSGNNIVQDLEHFQAFLLAIEKWSEQNNTVETVRYLTVHAGSTNFLDYAQTELWHHKLNDLLQEGYDSLMITTETDDVLLTKLFQQVGTFSSDLEIQEFIGVINDPNNFPSTYSSLSVYLNAVLPVYFDYATTAERNTLTSNITNVTVIKQLLHRQFNKLSVYEFLESKLEISQDALALVLAQNHPYTNIPVFNYLVPTANTVSPPVDLDTALAYQYVYKYSLLVQTQGLSLEEIKALAVYGDHSSPLGIINAYQVPTPVNMLPFPAIPASMPGGLALPTMTAWTIDQWNNTWIYRQFCLQYDVDLALFFAGLEELNNSGNLVTFFRELEELLGWDFADLTLLHNHFGWLVNDYLRPEKYQELAQIISWSRLSQESIATWLQWPIIFDINHSNYISNQKNIALEVKQSLQQVVTVDQWGKYKQGIYDKIRIEKRNSLVAYTKHYAPDGTPVLLSVNELYKYYLIDPAMSSCQYTSRIKQAISSVQLFIQRSLLGLEAAVDTTATEWKQWEWMQNYRVWEANRKVFLYPENWIEPTLRDNKSEIFQQFEDKISQNEITHENVELALQEYLLKLHHIANLEMKSICYGPDDQTVYVLARTKEHPADYYYRKLDRTTGMWTAWGKIEPLIKGEHPVLQYYNNRLHIFWLEILERPQEQVVQHDAPAAEDLNKTLPQAPKYKEIQLAWIVLYEAGWSPQTLSKQKLIHPWPRPNYSLHLRPRHKVNDLWLDIYVSTSLEFNGSHFYNQFNNAYERLTDEGFSENSRPWHSSSFVFDSFVREIKVKPISGTYWYVGWEAVNGNPISTVTRLVPITNSGPIWIRSLSNVLTSASASTTRSKGIVETNYGTFNLSINSEMAEFSDLMETTRVNAPSSSRRVLITAYYSNNQSMFKIVSLSPSIAPLYLSVIELNRYIQDTTASPIEPKETITITITNYARNLVPAASPDVILKLTDSDSYEYIKHSFGEDGRKIKEMQSHEEKEVLDKPYGFRHKHNHIVPYDFYDGVGPLKVLRYSNIHNFGHFPGSYGLTNKKSNYKLTIPLESGKIVENSRYNNVLFQDEFRSFLLTREHANKWNSSSPMYHPFTRSFISSLGSGGLDSLYERGTQFVKGVNLQNYYEPRSGRLDMDELEEVRFNYDNSYGLYNYELFFHIPFLVATELSKNQRFEEAMKWFHYVFNPTGVPSIGLTGGGDTSKYWITKPFFKHSGQDYYDSLIQNLLANSSNNAVQKAIMAWRNNPFQPHLVARMRPVAYQKAIVMKYVDNLIAWGDQLFRRDTLESINQAALRYIMAAEILGDQPQTVASKKVEEKAYVAIKAALSNFSNANVQVQLENFAMWTKHPVSLANNNSPAVNINTKDFCIPKNEKLAKYWDLVADRMFKIRHCMNIDGVVRQLPLFAPPIDPALLVNAQANGINLGDVLNDLSLPKTHYKYRALGRLATQFCSEVKSLGQSLLSALQSKDAEGMSLLQAGNAMKVLDGLTSLKELQIEEAVDSIKSLELSKAAAQFRKDYYEGKDFMNAQEKTVEKMTRASITLDTVGIVLDGIAGVLTPIPEITAVVSFPPATDIQIISGQVLGRILTLASGIVSKTSGIVSKEAGMIATKGSFRRRQDEWDMQGELATKDIEQIEQQIATSKIRIEIAKKDLATHLVQMDNAQSEQEYLQSKYTNQQLYSWMTGQISTIYFQAYQLAFDMGKKAEKSMRYELALPSDTPSMINFGYWDSMKKGLLAGDKLMLALNKMEATYVDKHNRELELTKHISLRLLDPQALLSLKNTGSCNLEIPQWWFDVDYPGHYLRRIKSLSISIPCITGPYTTIACNLTMTKNTIQKKDGTYDNYYETASIATSSAQNDSGVFELNFNGERYLPFEGAGAMSRWTLKLPDTDMASFDYKSITDVVLHMNYMAKDGGALMASNAKAALKNHLSTWSEIHPPVTLLSLKTAFGTAWHRFQNPTVAGTHQLNFDVDSKHYPYLSSLFVNRTVEAANIVIVRKDVSAADLILSFDAKAGGTLIGAGSYSTTINSGNLDGDLDLGLSSPIADIVDWKLDFSGLAATDIGEIDDIFLLLKYKLSS